MLQMRQKDLTKSAIATETELKLAEMEAKKQLDIRIQENVAEVEMARRKAVVQKEETSLLETQYASQRKVAEATGDVQAERLHMQLEMERKLQMAQIEAEEMRLKGFNQRDVMQADVQKAYANALGQMGANGGGGLGEIAGLGVTLGAMGGIMGMTREAMSPMMNMGVQNAAPAAPAPASADGWECAACGAKNIQTKFCPECGAKKPEPKPAETWDCPQCGNKGITAKFCGECGCKKPEPPATWDCPECGNKGITAKFCGECGCRKPEPKLTWNCPECGNKDITAKFCPECGHKKP
jgi:membrane protease subunit (stomatin/prohibitin family)